MAMAKSGYTLQVIKAGQQGHVEMRWGHLAEVDTRAAAATIAQHIGRPSSAADQCCQRHLGGASSPGLRGKRHPGFY